MVSPWLSLINLSGQTRECTQNEKAEQEEIIWAMRADDWLVDLSRSIVPFGFASSEPIMTISQIHADLHAREKPGVNHYQRQGLLAGCVIQKMA